MVSVVSVAMSGMPTVHLMACVMLAFMAVPARDMLMMVMLGVRNSGFHVPGLVLFRRIVVVVVVVVFNHDKVLSEK